MRDATLPENPTSLCPLFGTGIGVMYFFFNGRRIVFVHGFQKKTQKTPRREIEIAEKRMDEFIKRAGGE